MHILIDIGNNMKKLGLLVLAAIALAGCTTTDYSTNLAGVSDHATVVVKDFVTLGIVTVQTTETHFSGPFGFKKRVEGSKVTFASLMQEAAKLEADDIINIRVDMHANYTKGFFDWLTGWSRSYTHTGTALAIKYTEKLDFVADPQLSGVPKMPEPSSAVKTSRSGKVSLK